MFRAGLLLIIRVIDSVQTAIGIDDEQQTCWKHV